MGNAVGGIIQIAVGDLLGRVASIGDDSLTKTQKSLIAIGGPLGEGIAKLLPRKQPFDVFAIPKLVGALINQGKRWDGKKIQELARKWDRSWSNKDIAAARRDQGIADNTTLATLFASLDWARGKKGRGGPRELGTVQTLQARALSGVPTFNPATGNIEIPEPLSNDTINPPIFNATAPPQPAATGQASIPTPTSNVPGQQVVAPGFNPGGQTVPFNFGGFVSGLGDVARGIGEFAIDAAPAALQLAQGIQTLRGQGGQRVQLVNAGGGNTPLGGVLPSSVMAAPAAFNSLQLPSFNVPGIDIVADGAGAVSNPFKTTATGQQRAQPHMRVKANGNTEWFIPAGKPTGWTKASVKRRRRCRP